LKLLLLQLCRREEEKINKICPTCFIDFLVVSGGFWWFLELLLENSENPTFQKTKIYKTLFEKSDFGQQNIVQNSFSKNTFA
jgi:hypothetical protein